MAVMGLARELIAAFGRLPRSFNVWLRQQHGPINVGTDEQPRPYCTLYRTNWPCPEEIRLAQEADIWAMDLARHDGRCEICGEDRSSTEIRAVDGEGWIHAECLDNQERP